MYQSPNCSAEYCRTTSHASFNDESDCTLVRKAIDWDGKPIDSVANMSINAGESEKQTTAGYRIDKTRINTTRSKNDGHTVGIQYLCCRHKHEFGECPT